VRGFIPVRNMGKSHFCTACPGRDKNSVGQGFSPANVDGVSENPTLKKRLKGGLKFRIKDPTQTDYEFGGYCPLKESLTLLVWSGYSGSTPKSM